MRPQTLRWAICLFGLVALTAPLPAQAMWMPVDTLKVPIERVLANLQQKLRTNSNDINTLYQLGRVHSMAFAQELSAEVWVTKRGGRVQSIGDPVLWPWETGLPALAKATTVPPPANPAARAHLRNAVFFYQRAAQLLKKGSNAETNRWLVSPIQLGLAWNLQKAERRPEAIQAYREALATAWRLEVDQSLPLRERLSWSWDQLRARRNPLSKPPHGFGPGVCFSEEIIGYFLPLLDPVKDAREIAQLRTDKATLLGMGRAITPILVPLISNTPFAELVNPAATVPFDLDGSGLLKRWGWITPQAAWLVYDADASGQITSGLQLFGNATFWIFWRDGYAALAALDDNGDGRLTGAELQHLALWRDANGNGVSDPGEVRPLADYGITELECAGQTDPAGMVFHPTGVRFQDGTTRPTYDWPAPMNRAPVTVP